MEDIIISILIIDNKNKKDTRMLTVENNKSSYDILIPNGHPYHDEAYLNAAVRIVKKETGLTINATDLKFLTIDNENQQLNFTYIIHKWSDVANKRSKWVNIDELKFSVTYSYLVKKYQSYHDNNNKSDSYYSYVPSCNIV